MGLPDRGASDHNVLGYHLDQAMDHRRASGIGDAVDAAGR